MLRLKSLWAASLACALAACAGPRSASPTPAPIVVQYTPSEAHILNPERGFYTPFDLPATADFSFVRATGNTLLRSYVRLDDYRQTDLPPDFLDELDASFAMVRAGGVKVILRFAYNFGPYPDSKPDASREQILRHIEQLAPLLQRNADVLAWLEAGFIGAWGEWHTSTHGLDRSFEDKRAILSALLEALPPSRMVQLRYPSDIWELFGEPLGETEAFTATDRARIGHHNDCFLSSHTDVGTYDRAGLNTRVDDQRKLAQISRFSPVGGETCAPFPPRSECESALQEMALLHFTEINEAFHKGVIRSWQRGGCLDEINKRLGYRLVLESAEYSPRVRPGGVLHLAVTINNEGFASLINPRPLHVVLDGPVRLTVQLTDIEARRWEPGPSDLKAALRVPAGAPPGTYRLALWLPDAAPALRDDARYAVQFANEGVWDDSAGFNVLAESVVVDPSAAGPADPASDTFSLISVTSER